jgi:hypothetical protein
MKSLIFSIGLMLSIQQLVYAQKAEFRGGFGHLNTGLEVQSLRNAPGGAIWEGQQSAISFSGAGYGGFIGNRVIIGGGGFGNLSTISGLENANTTMRHDVGAGFARVGFILTKPQKRNFSFLYAGVGGGGTTITYENSSNAPVAITEQLSVPAGSKRRLSAGSWGWEAGISYSYLLYDPTKTDGGFLLGLEAGMMMMPNLRWEDGDGNRVQGLQNSALQGFFVRLMVGMGSL